MKLIKAKSCTTFLTAAVVTLGATLALPAAVINLSLMGLGGPGLLSTNEVPAATNGVPGSGDVIGSGIVYDTLTKILTINVGWGSGNGFTDLSGPATMAHIHGNAGQTQTAGVVFDLGGSMNSSATNGSITNFSTPALTASQESALLSGLWYINVHTAANGPGEIRGNMIPEPSVAGLGVLGLFAMFRRKRA